MRLWGMVAAVKWVLCAQARPATLTFGKLLLEKNMPPQGVAKVPFKKYLTLNFFGQLIWTAILLSVGYLFGNIYTTIDKSFQNIALVALIIITIALVYGFGKYLSRKLGERLQS